MILKAGHIDLKLFISGGVLFVLCLLSAVMFDLPALMLLPVLMCIAFLFLKDIRIAFYMLIFTLPVSFQFMEKYDFPDEPLMILNTVFFLFFCLYNQKRIQMKGILLHPMVISVMLTLVWLLITILMSKNTLLSFKFLLKKSWYIAPFFLFPLILFRDKQVIIRSFQWLFVSFFCIVLIVLIRFSAVGFAFDKVHDPVQPFFQNHVMYGSMVSIVVPFIVAAIFLSRKLSVQWLFSLAGFVIFLFAVYFSYSRAAWAAILFAMLCYAAVRLKLMHYFMLAFYVLVFGMVVWLSGKNTYLSYKPKFEKTIMHESLEDHILATIQGTDISSAERYYRWIAALRMSSDHPVFGVGPNNFYDHYKPYTITSFKTWVSRNPERSTTHNYFLFMLVEQGVPGMLLYTSLIFIIFYYGQKVYHRQDDRFNKIVVMSALCAIAAIFINNFFSELLETDKIGSIFYLSIALIIAIDTRQRMTSISQKASFS
ncbi:MAG: O-antigen ligase family protein [Chitinophagaceae bacterium]|nr:O-antigen ligase family protein [Chitinophagaceae bacterium]